MRSLLGAKCGEEALAGGVGGERSAHQITEVLVLFPCSASSQPRTSPKTRPACAKRRQYLAQLRVGVGAEGSRTEACKTLGCVSLEQPGEAKAAPRTASAETSTLGTAITLIKGALSSI